MLVGFYFVSLVLVLLQINLQQPAMVQAGTSKLTHFLSSCTGIQTELPNLSFAKSYAVVPTPFTTCAPDLNPDPTPRIKSFTWYYYASYPPPPCSVPPSDECCHSTATMTVNFTLTTFVTTTNTVTQTSTGPVISGPFLGGQATLIANFESASAACLNPFGPGMETKSGLSSLSVVGGPICTGVATVETCPGLHIT